MGNERLGTGNKVRALGAIERRGEEQLSTARETQAMQSKGVWARPRAGLASVFRARARRVHMWCKG